ncbi:MAG: hypothetical protein WAN11_19150 [Syntrophobacteraceae bacterium]
MSRIAKVWVTVFFTLVSCSGATLACADWSLEWTQNYPPEHYGSFTKIEFFIMPGSTSAVTFDAPASISLAPGSSSGWNSTLPNSDYSVLTGPSAKTATLTTYFSGPPTANFDLDIVLWNGSTVVERQQFDWLGGSWEKAQGTLILDSSGGFDAGDYNRTSETGVPIPSTILLFAPAGLGVLLLRKRISAIPC